MTHEFDSERELVTAEQIEIILGVDFDAAQREYDYALNNTNNGSKELLLIHFCEMKGLDAREIFESFHPPSETWTKQIEEFEEFEELDFQSEIEVELKNHQKWKHY